MVIKRKKKKTAKPADLPGRWLKSKSGRSISAIIVVKGDGEQLYRLQSLMFDYVDPNTGNVRHLTVSEKLWTEAELCETGRFLTVHPTRAQILAAKAKGFA